MHSSSPPLQSNIFKAVACMSSSVPPPHAKERAMGVSCGDILTQGMLNPPVTCESMPNSAGVRTLLLLLTRQVVLLLHAIFC